MSILPLTKNLQQFKYDLVLVGVTFIWGSTFFMAKEVVSQVPPINYLSTRFLIASLLLIAISYKQKLDVKSIKGGIVLGSMLYGGFLFQAAGLIYTSASKSGFVTGVTVIIVPFFSYFISRSKIISEHLLAIFLATIGFTIITLPGKNEPINIGDILTLIGTIFWAFHIVFTGVWTQRVPSKPLLLGQIVTAAILFNLSKICFPILAVSFPILNKLSILANNSWPFDSFKMILQLVYLGTIATILTIFAQTFAQKYVTATRAAIIFSLEPAFASIMAYIFAGEKITWRTIVGGILIIIAIIISEIKIFSRPPSNNSAN
ncbi:MAG: EamA family transporter [Acidobacteria bacterium]|nr:EamA family transporter [Acidobacteriota bacterium]